MERMTTMIGVVALAGCIAGCAQTSWVRSNATTVDLEREKFECQYEALKVTASARMGAADESKRNEFEANCMQVKGWSQ
jgi:hypothetical protein